MKIIVLAALVAVVAADSHYPVYPTVSYPAPAEHQPIHNARPYGFDYAVRDDQSGNHFGQQENSDGKVVSGSYHVLLPDGRVQTVTYTADDYYGYVAKVSYSGQAPAYPAPTYPMYSHPAPAHPAPTYPETAYTANRY